MKSVVNAILVILIASGLILANFIPGKWMWEKRDPGRVEAIVYSDSMNEFVDPWLDEVRRKYTDAVVVFCHGSAFSPDIWMLCPDKEVRLGRTMTFDVPMNIRSVTSLVQEVQKAHPGRHLVLVTCNPFHLPLPPELHDVSWTSEDVYLQPDRRLRTQGVGGIVEFHEQ